MPPSVRSGWTIVGRSLAGGLLFVAACSVIGPTTPGDQETSLHVLTGRSGSGGDPDGIVVTIKGAEGGVERSAVLALGDSTAFLDLSPGGYDVWVSGLVLLCAAIPRERVVLGPGRNQIVLTTACDGRFAYDRLLGNGERQVWYVDSEGQHNRVSAHNRARSWSFSPSGSRLLLLRQDPSGVGTEVVTLRGESVSLRPARRCSGSIVDARWAPDESIILAREVGEGCPDGRNALVLFDPRDGSPLRAIQASDSVLAADWSPDGTRLALLRGHSLYTTDADSGSSRSLHVFPPARQPHTVQWSPGGRYVLVSLGNPAQLLAVDVETQQVVGATSPSHSAVVAAWHPDGEAFAFVGRTPTRSAVFVFDIADGSERELFPSLDEWAIWPSWSADGGRLLFSGVQSVFVGDVASGAFRAVVTPSSGADAVLEARWQLGQSYPR